MVLAGVYSTPATMGHGMVHCRVGYSVKRIKKCPLLRKKMQALFELTSVE